MPILDKTAKQESLLTFVEDQKALPPFIVLHGLPGTGKTTFGASCPDVIFIKTEEGAGLLKYKSFPRAKTYLDVIDQLETLLKEKHTYKTLVIDTITGVENLVGKHVADLNGWADIEAPDYGRGPKASYTPFEEVLKYCLALRASKQMNIVLLAHSEVKRFDPPNNPGFDRYQMQLFKGNHAAILAPADVVMFINHKVVVSEEKNKKPKAHGLGVYVYTVDSPMAVAKNRLNLPDEVPFPQENGFQFLFGGKKDARQ